MLAGISAEYYLRLERGRAKNPSPQVLVALARVLHLDPKATKYLHELARPNVGRCDESELEAVAAGSWHIASAGRRQVSDHFDRRRGCTEGRATNSLLAITVRPHLPTHSDVTSPSQSSERKFLRKARQAQT